MTLPDDFRLTPRRLEIATLIANGRTNAVIARMLWIGEESVKSHVQLMKGDLGARDRAHLASVCLVRGLIHPHEVELLPPKVKKTR